MAVTADRGVGVVGSMTDITHPGTAAHQLEGVTVGIRIGTDGRSGGNQRFLLGLLMTINT